jgi:hypothetical protein
MQITTEECLAAHIFLTLLLGSLPGRWVQRIRQDYKRNVLTDQQIFQMDSLGFTWKCARGRQKINYASDIPNYFQSQEYLQKFNGNNNVDQEQQQDGAIWSPKTAPEFWDAQFDKLKTFQAQHGHCNVPRNHFVDQSLAKWVVAQCSFYHKNQLSEENISKLESIGFIWRLQRHWEENYILLEAYYNKHGHTDVPVDYSEDPKLGKTAHEPLWRRSYALCCTNSIHHSYYFAFSAGRWAREQRLFSKRKELTQERLDRMKALDFVWNAPGTTSALTKRPKSMASPKEPSAVKGTPSWSGTAYEKGPIASALKEKTVKLQQANAKLGEDRKHLKMENQELRRKLREAEEKNVWESRFEELQIYKDLNGNCLVPTSHSKLGFWVASQREQYKKEALSQERVEKLESLGFVWERSKGRPKKDEGSDQRSENCDLMEEEVRLQEEKVKLLEAKVKLQQEKLKLRLIKESGQTLKSKRKSEGSDGCGDTKVAKTEMSV